ncbi:MAG: O-antigen ligase family protein [Gemmatimonadota bacterium]|nr:O-antigen ligase family protein [Gemmatimonadota bacterium]
MAMEAGGSTARMHGRWLIPAVCLAQLAVIALPAWQFGEVIPLITVSLIVVSGIALMTSVTSALLYLCFIASVISSEFYEEHLMLPGNLHFCEALFVVVWGVAFVAWLQERKLSWRRTRLDRPMLVFLGLVAASIGLGLFYGHDVRQVMRDVRYPLYYVLFFVATGFFDLRRRGTFLAVLVISAAVVGVEYLIEFVRTVDLSYAGAFYRVARREGLLLPMGVLVIAAAFLYDTSPVRRMVVGLLLVPIGLALVVTMGRAMWGGLLFGLFCLGGLVLLDRGRHRGRRLLILLMIPILLLGLGYYFQQFTGAGIEDMAAHRLRRTVTEGDLEIQGRLLAYALALEKIWQRPLLGGGHGTTISYLRFDEYSRPYIFTSGGVDNTYLTIMMRMGVVGVIAFLWIFARGLRIAYGLFRRSDDPRLKGFCVAFLAVYAALLVYIVTDNTMMGNRLIFWHACFLGILARLDGEADETRGDGGGRELEFG